MIDLHIHTKFSDGTNSVEEIIEECKKLGIKYASITDHDTNEACKYLNNNYDLLENLETYNIKMINGIEFSSIIDGNKIHLLGYNYDFDNKELLKVIDIGKQKRYNKFLLRIKAMKEQLGIELSKNSFNELNKRKDFIGKPILAHYMVKDGIFKSFEDCFSKCFDIIKLNPLETRVDARLIIPAINKANGICIWAHPLGGINEPKISYKEVEKIIELLLPLGLRGIECYYSLYTKIEADNLVKIAKKYNLLVSAGSDYHGLNKKVKIGELSCDNSKIDVNNIIIINSIK